MSYFVQLIVDGLATGSIYGALALAIVIVNRSTGMINFAQGAMAVLCAFVAYAVWQAGLPIVVGLLAAVVFGLLLGAVLERLVVRRFERGDPNIGVVATIGLLLLVTGIAAAIWSYDPRPFPSLFPNRTLDIGGVFVGVRSIGTIAVLVVVIVLLQLLFQRTKLGLAMRAVADNPDSSALSGLPVSRLLMLGWALAAALGAVAGVLVAPQLFISPTMLDFTLVYALAAAILGGLESPVGAVVAGWFIGVVENLAGAYVDLIGNDLKIAVPFVAMIVILILRPQGLFGRQTVVRV
jgi:branched-chain amino acid transport system permease protein